MSYCEKCFNVRCQQRWHNRCTDCNLRVEGSHYAAFEFHHLDPAQKDADWSQLRLLGRARIMAELAKCVLLCANCHRIWHATQLVAE